VGEAVALQQTEVLGEHLVADVLDGVAQLAEAEGAVAEGLVIRNAHLLATSERISRARESARIRR
jgi:hypothetical protein